MWMENEIEEVKSDSCLQCGWTWKKYWLILLGAWWGIMIKEGKGLDPLVDVYACTVCKCGESKHWYDRTRFVEDRAAKCVQNVRFYRMIGYGVSVIWTGSTLKNTRQCCKETRLLCCIAIVCSWGRVSQYVDGNRTARFWGFDEETMEKQRCGIDWEFS